MAVPFCYTLYNLRADKFSFANRNFATSEIMATPIGTFDQSKANFDDWHVRIRLWNTICVLTEQDEREIIE